MGGVILGCQGFHLGMLDRGLLNGTAFQKLRSTSFPRFISPAVQAPQNSKRTGTTEWTPTAPWATGYTKVPGNAS